MSVIVEIFPQCDVCFETYADNRYTTLAACRRNMLADGWRKRHGKDVCRYCAEKASIAEDDPAGVSHER